MEGLYKFIPSTNESFLNKFVSLLRSNYNLANKWEENCFAIEYKGFDNLTFTGNYSFTIIKIIKCNILDTYFYHKSFCLVSILNQYFYQFSLMAFLTILFCQWKMLRWTITFISLRFDSIAKDFVFMDGVQFFFECNFLAWFLLMWPLYESFLFVILTVQHKYMMLLLLLLLLLFIFNYICFFTSLFTFEEEIYHLLFKKICS